MIAPVAALVLLSPFTLVEASIDRGVFPKGAEDWDRIGIYRLRDGDKDHLVLLYYRDSFSVDEKRRKKEGFFPSSYPNVFSVHALYRDQTGKWVHQRVFHDLRVNFSKVAESACDHLTLECRPNWLFNGEDEGKSLKRLREIHKPFTKRVSFVDGVLTAN